MRQGSSAGRAHAPRHTALADAIAPVTAALLVPVLVGFALEVPADAIDRIASPFVGQARAAVVTRKTENDGPRRAVRTSVAPQLYPGGIVAARPRRTAAVAAPSVPRARRILPLDHGTGVPASSPRRAEEPAPTSVVRRPRRAPLPGDEDVPVQPDRGPVPAADEPAGGIAPRTPAPPPSAGAGAVDTGATAGPAAPETGAGAGEAPAAGAGDGGAPVAGDGGDGGSAPVQTPTEPPPADGPGNSENAPGHKDGGPGNSENAPGHAKKEKGDA